MGNWNAWQHAYDRLTYAQDGDQLEMDFALIYDISAQFPNHEKFWRTHVAPATNRPADINWRPRVALEVQRVIALNYGVLYDLHEARSALEDISAGNYGYMLSTFTSCLKSIGDAFQKHYDLVHTAIQRHLRIRLNLVLSSPLTIWTKDEYDRLWKPRRDELVNYRHYLTHEAARPFVVPVENPSGSPSYFAIRRDYLTHREQRPTLEEQYALFQSDSTIFAPIAVICQELYDDALAWLNCAYETMLSRMEPLLHIEEYHELWGWDGPPPGVGSGSAPLIPYHGTP